MGAVTVKGNLREKLFRLAWAHYKKKCCMVEIVVKETRQRERSKLRCLDKVKASLKEIAQVMGT